MPIRPERPDDATAVHEVTALAFKDVPYSEQTEPAIVDALRADGALTISLVFEECDVVIGHVAFSPVKISGQEAGWFGLGPVSVLPSKQHRGVGQALVHEGLNQLRTAGAAGCVVLGDPKYYGRFGFTSDPRLTYADAPPPYFQRLAFGVLEPSGAVTYHPGFAAQ